MIRVLHIIDTIMSGGVERRRLSLAKLLDSEQFELKIICTNAVGSFPEEFKKYGVEVIDIGDLISFINVKQHKKVMKVIDDFKPHIIHGAVFEGVTMASINGFLKRVPIIILEETSDPQNRRWKGHLLMKLLTLPADKVIGVSQASTNYLTEKLKISKEKVKLINNGVALPLSVDILNNSICKAGAGKWPMADLILQKENPSCLAQVPTSVAMPAYWCSTAVPSRMNAPIIQ